MTTQTAVAGHQVGYGFITPFHAFWWGVGIIIAILILLEIGAVGRSVRRLYKVAIAIVFVGGALYLYDTLRANQAALHNFNVATTQLLKSVTPAQVATPATTNK